jgi:integrase
MPKLNKPKQLSSGRWYVRVYGEDGKRRGQTFETHDDAMAAISRNQMAKSKIRAGVIKPGSSLTVKQAYETWIKRRAGRAKEDSEYHFDQHILPELGDRALGAVDDATIEDFMRRLERKQAARKGQKQGESGKLLSKKTIKNVLVTLGKFLADNGFPRRIRYKVQAPDYAWIEDPADVVKFLHHCEPEWFRVAAAIAVYAGLRLGEVAGLERGALDFENRIIRVSRSYDGPTKSRKVRHVPMAPELSKILKPWILANSGRLVVTRNGEAIKEGESLSPETARACKVAFTVKPEEGTKKATQDQSKQAPDICFHDLRHTFASHLAMRGVSLQEIALLLGHSSVLMVQRYAHLLPDSVVRSPRVHLSFNSPRGKVLPLPAAEGRDAMGHGWVTADQQETKETA